MAGGGGPLQNCKELQLVRLSLECLFRRGVLSMSLRMDSLQSPQEGRMSKFALGLLTLAVFATALVVVPMVTPAEAATSSAKHIKKHKKKIQKSHGFSDPWSAGQARPVARPSGQAGGVCPGLARSFDCKIWPPPMEDDPDRRNSGPDH
jgi:hypothetical protein